MPHMLDGVGMVLDKVSKDKCPICEKKKHDTTKAKKDGEGELKSIPKNLGCTAIKQRPSLPNYTTAAHHLIPANQCLKAFSRLSQMCKAVGYDVNNSKNGMSLPTVGQGKANVYTDRRQKYGKLSDEDKREVSFLIMERLDKQWHVGHHKWSTGELNLNTDGIAHVENYDKLVKIKLRDLEQDIKDTGEDICDPKKKERGTEIIDSMNALSAEIGGKVTAWNNYFVSALSCKFAAKYR